MMEPPQLPAVVVFTFTLNTATGEGQCVGNVPPPVALSMLQSLVINILAQQRDGGQDAVTAAPDEPAT